MILYQDSLMTMHEQCNHYFRPGATLRLWRHNVVVSEQGHLHSRPALQTITAHFSFLCRFWHNKPFMLFFCELLTGHNNDLVKLPKLAEMWLTGQHCCHTCSSYIIYTWSDRGWMCPFYFLIPHHQTHTIYTTNNIKIWCKLILLVLTYNTP